MPALLDYEWCLAVDLDEWFVPSELFDHKLPPLLAQEALQDADAVVAHGASMGLIISFIGQSN